jgi:hypothetical protein
MAQTAVDYIFKKLDVLFTLTPQTRVTGTKEEWETLYKKAKAMEKDQITGAYLTGLVNPLEMKPTKQSEEYYNKTYNK